MVLAVFVRRLREGMCYEDFVTAWKADQGFGVAARVFSAVSLEDPRDLLTVGFVDLEAEELQAGLESVAAQEGERHSRIDDVIESTTLKAMYELGGEYDFSADPREIEIGGAESFLAGFGRLGQPNGD